MPIPVRIDSPEMFLDVRHKEKILVVQRELADIENKLSQAYKRWEELESK